VIDFNFSRKEMTNQQIEARGIKNKRVLSVFKEIPRELFISDQYQDSAYGDYPLPIGSGQTISQPYMVALMTEKLSLKETDIVLEVGTGSGYQAAILAKLCRQVYSVERFPLLAEKAKLVLSNLNIGNVEIKTGDGTLGWQEHAPYDAIIVTASAPQIPKPLVDQLKEGGRLVAPVGSLGSQSLVRATKRRKKLEEEHICGCVFVPLVGKFGWRDK
jgi:protein-L-isoaspartate(D-aspartate) O-methyltransferase